MRSILEAWSPDTTSERDAVLFELDCILADPHFRNSKRYPALLRYVVERTLEGKSDLLKERTLGIEVFHRPVDYDTNADTVVRYTAGEVRKRLSLYYHEHEPSSDFQISLPAGSYVPEFLKQQLASGGLAMMEATLPRSANASRLVESEEAHGPVTPLHVRRRRPWMAVGLVSLLLFTGGLTWRLASRHGSAIDQFWAPTLHEQGSTLICAGGVVFQKNNYSGVTTAGKDIDYPSYRCRLPPASDV